LNKYSNFWFSGPFDCNIS